MILQEFTVQLTVRGVSPYGSDILASSSAERAWNWPSPSPLPSIYPALDPRTIPVKLWSGPP